MRALYFTFAISMVSWTIASAQLIEAEGNVKIDNTLELFDRSSGAPHKVGTLTATFPAGANNANSPTLTLKTETSPIASNGFADILLQSSDEIFLNTNAENRLYIGPSGRVGIGTQSPSKLLQVTDDIVIGGGSTGYNSASEYLRLASQNEDWYIAALNQASQAASDFSIGLSSGASSYFHIENGGDIGIGTSEPIARLHVEDDSHQLALRNGIDATNTWYVGASAPTWLAGDHKLVFDDDNSSSAPILCLDGMAEAVSIGTSYVPSGYKLAVNGAVIAEEVVVELREDWPDYVFLDDYPLRPLSDVQKTIKELGHLPGIPSALEVEKDGIALGDMQRRMLEKIEELMLYVINLDKDNETLKQEVITLKKSIQ